MSTGIDWGGIHCHCMNSESFSLEYTILSPLYCKLSSIEILDKGEKSTFITINFLRKSIPQLYPKCEASTHS